MKRTISPMLEQPDSNIVKTNTENKPQKTELPIVNTQRSDNSITLAIKTQAMQERTEMQDSLSNNAKLVVPLKVLNEKKRVNFYLYNQTIKKLKDISRVKNRSASEVIDILVGAVKMDAIDFDKKLLRSEE